VLAVVLNIDANVQVLHLQIKGKLACLMYSQPTHRNFVNKPTVSGIRSTASRTIMKIPLII
jgi:hypothetical protein